jgi:hypothetical protein
MTASFRGYSLAQQRRLSEDISEQAAERSDTVNPVFRSGHDPRSFTYLTPLMDGERSVLGFAQWQSEYFENTTWKREKYIPYSILLFFGGNYAWCTHSVFLK